MPIDPEAKKILDNRLASGEIDEDEYSRLLRVLNDEEHQAEPIEPDVRQDTATSSQTSETQAVESHPKEAVPAAVGGDSLMRRLLEQIWYAFLVPGFFFGAALMFPDNSFNPKHLLLRVVVAVGVGVPCSFFIYNWINKNKDQMWQLVLLSLIVISMWAIAIPTRIIPALFPKNTYTEGYDQERGPLTSEQEDNAAQDIYIDMRYDFRQWKEAIKEGDSLDIRKYQSRITVDLENNLDKYPDANRETIRKKVHALNLSDN